MKLLGCISYSPMSFILITAHDHVVPEMEGVRAFPCESDSMWMDRSVCIR